jgi:hypothetical protein
MKREVPMFVQVISLAYGFNAFLFLFIAMLVTLQLCLHAFGSSLIGGIDHMGVALLSFIVLFFGALGSCKVFIARGLWSGSRIALLFAITLSFLSVLSSVGAVLAFDFDGVFTGSFIFHAICLAYLGFSKEVRTAFA